MIEMQFMIAFFHFAMSHFLKIDVNVFVVNCHFHQWISGVEYTEIKRFRASIMNSLNLSNERFKFYTSMFPNVNVKFVGEIAFHTLNFSLERFFFFKFVTIKAENLQ